MGHFSGGSLLPPHQNFKAEDSSNTLFHIKLFSSFCFGNIHLKKNPSLIGFLPFQTTSNIPQNSFPLHFPTVIILSYQFCHESPCFDVFLLPVCVDEQYFTPCHLDLLCLSAPALSIQF